MLFYSLLDHLMQEPLTESSFPVANYSENHQLFMKPEMDGIITGDNNNRVVDYMLNNNAPPQQQLASGFATTSASLSSTDVMQFAEAEIDPVHFLKFSALNENLQEDYNSTVQAQFLGEDVEKNSQMGEGKNKKKRPRTTKTIEEVETQRMTHIAVERNRRKQMNEHLRILRSLMPGSYVQRGDQASIIGGAIEFVRELEQLLQCLESQKRRRLYGDTPPPRPIRDSLDTLQPTQVPPFFNPTIVPASAPDDPINFMTEYDNGLIREESAESKSSVADVEVRVLGHDAMIKILCRRSPGQLIKTIAALQDLELNILHTNITTIEQTVLYSFNVKVGSEVSFTADDIANSVQQTFNFMIHAKSNI